RSSRTSGAAAGGWSPGRTHRSPGSRRSWALIARIARGVTGLVVQPGVGDARAACRAAQPLGGRHGEIGFHRQVRVHSVEALRDACHRSAGLDDADLDELAETVRGVGRRPVASEPRLLADAGPGPGLRRSRPGPEIPGTREDLLAQGIEPGLCSRRLVEPLHDLVGATLPGFA